MSSLRASDDQLFPQYPMTQRQRRRGPGEVPETHTPRTSRSRSGWCRRRGRGNGRTCWHLQGRGGEVGEGSRAPRAGREHLGQQEREEGGAGGWKGDAMEWQAHGHEPDPPGSPGVQVGSPGESRDRPLPLHLATPRDRPPCLAVWFLADE